jgi:hypothetical protein
LSVVARSTSTPLLVAELLSANHRQKKHPCRGDEHGRAA